MNGRWRPRVYGVRNCLVVMHFPKSVSSFVYFLWLVKKRSSHKRQENARLWTRGYFLALPVIAGISRISVTTWGPISKVYSTWCLIGKEQGFHLVTHSQNATATTIYYYYSDPLTTYEKSLKGVSNVPKGLIFLKPIKSISDLSSPCDVNSKVWKWYCVVYQRCC